MLARPGEAVAVNVFPPSISGRRFCTEVNRLSKFQSILKEGQGEER